MIARQIGEGGRTDRDTVEAVLREAVARRLDRGVLDALPRQFGEIAVQGDRVGRRQRTGATPGGQDKAERAEACRRMPEARPDLAREMRHRGLAVGAGHGCDRSRLAAVEARCEDRQPALWMGVGDNGNAPPHVGIERQRVGIVGQDRCRAFRGSFGCKGAPVALRAAQGGEQIARLDLA